MTHPDVGKYSESLVSGTVRPVEVLIDDFKHLPTGDELRSRPDLLLAFAKAIADVPMGLNWTNASFNIYDKSIVIKDKCFGRHHNGHYQMVISSLPKSDNNYSLVHVEVVDGQSSTRGDPRVCPDPIRLLQQGVPLASKDVLPKNHPREKMQPIDNLRGAFKKKGIEFKTFVGRHINATGREEDLIKEPGVFWVDSSGKLNLSVANPSIY
ncbi:hypothetical protein CO009_03090 [Candidatus Shapirobacteria bacterium CG_4_8_14_3_um_filter_35_11]|uniref:Uncharacterized protein n=1 Tax=Candidatus Shapirobacteria bacterium CG_4_8_14_3_um_filter_35_11 TaxID=1974874 RepID=A0A2M8GJ70_9BACT|nr:MAG: hypothetical protein CO009_03090 [Candidatus Shapirobacteria bacterium CG_4_8_14_3_um_filter_35_11]